METFLFRKEWLDNISQLSLDCQDKVIAGLVRYGLGAQEREYEDVVVTIVNGYKKRIDFSNKKYEEVVREDRMKRDRDYAIYELAREGKTAKQIAEILGCSWATVTRSTGWQNRGLQKY